MTATEAVKMQLQRILDTPQAFHLGQSDAKDADVIFAGLEKDVEFQLFAAAHASLISLDPVRVAMSLLYCGYMAAKMEEANVIQN